MTLLSCLAVFILTLNFALLFPGALLDDALLVRDPFFSFKEVFLLGGGSPSLHMSSWLSTALLCFIALFLLPNVVLPEMNRSAKHHTAHHHTRVHPPTCTHPPHTHHTHHHTVPPGSGSSPTSFLYHSLSSSNSSSTMPSSPRGFPCWPARQCALRCK